MDMIRTIARPLRNLWVRLFTPRTSLEIGNLSATFSTPTLKLRRGVLRARGERDQIRAFVNEIRPGDIVWDVGSHIGTYSILSGMIVGQTGHVHAFDPDERSVAYIKNNIQLNDLHNVSVHHVALAETDGAGRLYIDTRQGFSTQSLVKEDGRTEKEIVLRSGDTLSKSLQAPTVMKIDVEGYEVGVLMGMHNMIKSASLRMILIELHPRLLGKQGLSLNDAQKLIEDANYTIDHSMTRGSEIHWLCRRA